MAHVELALSNLAEPGRILSVSSGSLDLWAYPVSIAAEPCLVVDTDGVVVAVSPGCASLLGIDAASAVGHSLVGGVLRLLDFGPVLSDLSPWEADKIPPRLAAKTGVLARGLMRFVGPGGIPRTVDAISVPLRDRGDAPVAGSLTFCSLVR